MSDDDSGDEHYLDVNSAVPLWLPEAEPTATSIGRAIAAAGAEAEPADDESVTDDDADFHDVNEISTVMQKKRALQKQQQQQQLSAQQAAIEQQAATIAKAEAIVRQLSEVTDMPPSLPQPHESTGVQPGTSRATLKPRESGGKPATGKLAMTIDFHPDAVRPGAGLMTEKLEFEAAGLLFDVPAAPKTEEIMQCAHPAATAATAAPEAELQLNVGKLELDPAATVSVSATVADSASEELPALVAPSEAPAMVSASSTAVTLAKAASCLSGLAAADRPPPCMPPVGCAARQSAPGRVLRPRRLSAVHLTAATANAAAAGRALPGG